LATDVLSSAPAAAVLHRCRWLSLAERLQLPEVASRILAYLRVGLAELGGQPGASAAVLAYAQEHLSKEQLLQLLQISMQAASSQQQQQSLQQGVFMQQQQPQMFMQSPQQTLSAAFNGWLGQGQSSSGSQGFSQQQQQMMMQQQMMQQPQQQLRLGWQQPVPLFNQGEQQQQQLGASTTCSGTSSDPTVGESQQQQLASDEGSSDNGEAPADSQQQQAVAVEQQRLKLCMSSGLFAPAVLPQQQQQQQRATCSAPAATPVASFAAPVPAVQARNVSAACPVPRFPVAQAGSGFTLRPQAMQQQAFGSQGESFGSGVNGGSASIADWMRSQPEGMCLS
jgi:DNA polymerase III gamma/tau subunit